jgi:hypothetical protein
VPEPGKDVIGVCRNNELPHGKSHPLRVITSENITEISGWNHELNLGALWMWDLPADMEIGEEIVDCLGKDACPIDGIDSAEVILVVERLVRE